MRLEDREAIRDCLARYCRAIDRAEEALLHQTYWPEATDCHGATSGPIEIFYERIRASAARNPRNVHQISQSLIEFRSDTTAAVESAFFALQESTGADGVRRRAMLAGRYCDLFEKRGSEWRVLTRVVVYDWVEHHAPFADTEAERFGVRLPMGAPWPHDPVYHI